MLQSIEKVYVCSAYVLLMFWLSYTPVSKWIGDSFDILSMCFRCAFDVFPMCFRYTSYVFPMCFRCILCTLQRLDRPVCGLGRVVNGHTLRAGAALFGGGSAAIGRKEVLLFVKYASCVVFPIKSSTFAAFFALYAIVRGHVIIFLICRFLLLKRTYRLCRKYAVGTINR